MKKLLLLLALFLVPGLASAEPVSAIMAIATIMGGAGGAMATGLALAGSAISLVGAITGNKKLKKVGSVVSLVTSAGSALSNAFGGAAAAGEAAGETVGAGAEALGQTAVSPAAEVAAGAAGGENALAGEVLNRQALQTGLTEGVNAGQAAQSAGQAALTGSANVGQAARIAGQVVQPSAGPSALSRVGSFIKENKELVNLGGGLVKGAMEGYGQERAVKDAAKRAEEAEARRRAQFNASILGINPQGQFIRPDADVVSGQQTQDPARYMARARRGLIRSTQGA
jgi:hypothetical protein